MQRTCVGEKSGFVLRLFRSAPRDVFVLCVAIYLYVYRVQTMCLCSGCALKNPQNGSEALIYEIIINTK